MKIFIIERHDLDKEVVEYLCAPFNSPVYYSPDISEATRFSLSEAQVEVHLAILENAFYDLYQYVFGFKEVKGVK